MTAVPEAAAPSAAAPTPTQPGTEESDGRRFPRWLIALGALVVVAGVVLRFVTRSDLWLDEALTVNISRLPLSDLHEALRHDGAPPLFYLLLHGWISVFGDSDVAVRALAGVFSVATLPVIWFAGRRLGRPGAPGPIAADPPRARLVAGLSVIVLAASPFAVRYGTEARMYSLMMLLVALGYLALRRAFERPSAGRLALVALLVGALLYTQYWALYLLAVVGFGVLWRAWRAPIADDRHAARGVVVAMVAGFILFVPWLSTFLYQNAHTGTPWGSGEIPLSSFRIAIDEFGNGTSELHTQLNVLTLAFVVLVLLGVFARATGPTTLDVDLRTRPAVRWEAAVAFVTLSLGLTIAWVTNSAFDARYASNMFPLFVLVVAFGFTAFGSRTVIAIVVAVVVGTGFVGAARNVVDERTQAGAVADVILARAKPGDAVVYCPDQLAPAVSRLLERKPSLVQLTFPSGGAPELVDWVDYQDRVDATDTAKFAKDVLDEVGSGHTIWYVENGGYHGLQGKCEAVAAALGAARPGATTHVVGDDKAFFEYDTLVEFPPT
ncbi:MAG TPA: glycosyltransferase family 39 protein [Acidimicrobiia bacterium]